MIFPFDSAQEATQSATFISLRAADKFTLLMENKQFVSRKLAKRQLRGASDGSGGQGDSTSPGAQDPASNQPPAQDPASNSPPAADPPASKSSSGSKLSKSSKSKKSKSSSSKKSSSSSHNSSKSAGTAGTVDTTATVGTAGTFDPSDALLSKISELVSNQKSSTNSDLAPDQPDSAKSNTSTASQPSGQVSSPGSPQLQPVTVNPVNSNPSIGATVSPVTLSGGQIAFIVAGVFAAAIIALFVFVKFVRPLKTKKNVSKSAKLAKSSIIAPEPSPNAHRIEFADAVMSAATVNQPFESFEHHVNDGPMDSRDMEVVVIEEPPSPKDPVVADMIAQSGRNSDQLKQFYNV
jgi:hypothetical protein